MRVDRDQSREGRHNPRLHPTAAALWSAAGEPQRWTDIERITENTDHVNLRRTNRIWLLRASGSCAARAIRFAGHGTFGRRRRCHGFFRSIRQSRRHVPSVKATFSIEGVGNSIRRPADAVGLHRTAARQPSGPPEMGRSWRPGWLGVGARTRSDVAAMSRRRARLARRPGSPAGVAAVGGAMTRVGEVIEETISPTFINALLLGLLF